MKFHETPIAGVCVVELDLLTDERGFFARSYAQSAFAELSLLAETAEANVSFNEHVATLRGMHYQADPHPDPKLVRCTSGSMWDVALDLRPESSTYLQWFGTELSSENRNALHVPAGCAHGFITLEPATEVLYLMGERYHADLARGFAGTIRPSALTGPFSPPSSRPETPRF